MEDPDQKRTYTDDAVNDLNKVKNELSTNTTDERGTHTAAIVEKDLEEFRRSENPTQKQRDNLLESLASNSIQSAIWNRTRAAASQRIESTLGHMKDSLSMGISQITAKQDVTNGRINNLQEWRKEKDKLDSQQSKMIEDATKVHSETVRVLEEVKERLDRLERTDKILAEEVETKIGELKETDNKFEVLIIKLKEWKTQILVGAAVIYFLFKYDFIQIPEKYINVSNRDDFAIVKQVDKRKESKRKPE